MLSRKCDPAFTPEGSNARKAFLARLSLAIPGASLRLALRPGHAPVRGFL